MIRTLFASVALIGMVLVVHPSPLAAQTSPSTPAAEQPKAPTTAKGRMMGSRATAKKPAMARKTMPGHRLDNIADRLNTCQKRPQAERQSCMEQATRP